MTLHSPFPTTASAIESDVWYFGDFVLDLPRYELSRNGVPVQVEPQVFDVMVQLVKHHRRVVTKNELFDTVWGGRFVGEAALTSRIKAIRRALGDDGKMQRYIRTVRGRGYQFVGSLVEPMGGHIEPSADADDVRSERVLNLGIAVRSVGVPHCRRRSRGHGRAHYRVAPSTRRREFTGPPK